MAVSEHPKEGKTRRYEHRTTCSLRESDFVNMAAEHTALSKVD